MPVNLSIKNAPDELVTRLKRRAAENHRSMQGEVMAILHDATREPEIMTAERLASIMAKVRAIGHPGAAESVDMIREYRDREDP